MAFTSTSNLCSLAVVLIFLTAFCQTKIVRNESPDVEATDENINSVKVHTSNKNGCLITMPTDIPSESPVYVISTTNDKSSPQLLKPTGAKTILPASSLLTLYCIGHGNTLVDSKETALELTCQRDGSFFSEKRQRSYALNELQCTKTPIPDLQETSIPCADGKGYLLHPGFQLDEEHFLPTFSVCYDNQTSTTLYARNIVNGATTKSKIIYNLRPTFRASGMSGKTTAVNKLYTIKNQLERFTNYFGKKQSYIDKSKFLARGHLAPDADFIFAYEQMSTYFYVNVAPEFQTINVGNWIRVEHLARDLAAKYGTDLLAFTSIAGCLELPAESGGKKSGKQVIYLDEEQSICAPQWYYKVLMHPELEEDLVLITLNNPYAQKSDVQEFCQNVCERFGINNPSFENLSKGYTFCCTLKDFQSNLKDVPTFDLPNDWLAQA